METPGAELSKEEMADIAYRSMLEALADYEKARASEHAGAGKRPCIHGDLCRQYMREGRGILRASCPHCEFYSPKE